MPNISEPLITIITVTKDIIKNKRKDFLVQNFESIHNQTYKNIEHLIIDGASTDGTVDLLKEYAAKGWIRYISEPDNGIFDAMNKGHKKAKGLYVMVLNSDDWYASNTIIEEMKNEIEENQADYVFGDQNLLSEEQNKIKVKLKKAVPYQFWQTMPFNHPTIMIKNDIVKELGYYQTDFGTVEDYRFVIKLILNDCKGIYLPKAIVNFRLGGASFDEKTKLSLYKFRYKRVSKVFEWFYTQFDNRLTREKIIENYMKETDGTYDELFFIRLSDFMLTKNLKNFDYEGFFTYIEKIKGRSGKNKSKKILFFFGIPLLKIIKKGKVKVIKFLNIPIVKLKDI